MILQLLSILLLVGVAEADPVQLHTGGYVHILYKNDAGCVVYQKEDHLVTMTCPPSPCELKMKEAMKLIRPYIDYGEVGTTTDLLYRSPQTKLREEADRLDKRDAAVRKWEAIYKECVK